MNQTHQLFSERDRALIETSVYDSILEPRFNALSSYLMWNDELPSNITPDGIDVLSSLWVARAFIHHGFELPDLFDRNHFIELWMLAAV